MKKKIITIVFVIFISCSPFSRIEYVKIESIRSKESLYLKYYVRGLSYEALVLSKYKENNEPDSLKEFICGYGCAIFYKQANDTLYVYGGQFTKPAKNIYKTNIKFKEIDPVEYYELSKNYKKLGLTIFPPSKKALVENYSK